MRHINSISFKADQHGAQSGGATTPWGHDSVTLLQSKDEPVTKRLFQTLSGDVGKQNYEKATYFNAIAIDVAGIRDLSGLLTEIEADPYLIAIRGRIKGGEDIILDVRRRKHGDDAMFEEEPVGHHWVMLDLDAIPTPMFFTLPDDIEIAVGYMVRLLPSEFHDASFHWQWSCGAGLDGWKTLRVHLWFWSERRHTDQDLRRWGQWVNKRVGEKLIDCSVFRAVQPHYTAGPILDGVEDPCSRFRSGFHQGDRRSVRIEMPPAGWQPEQVRAMDLDISGRPRGSTDRWIGWLAEVGDDHMGFHEPITRAIASYATTVEIPNWEYLKECIRCVARTAQNTKGRDLEADYLSDLILDRSITGAVAKFRGGSR
jgi:hypothetical protein